VETLHCDVCTEDSSHRIIYIGRDVALQRLYKGISASIQRAALAVSLFTAGYLGGDIALQRLYKELPLLVSVVRSLIFGRRRSIATSVQEPVAVVLLFTV